MRAGRTKPCAQSLGLRILSTERAQKVMIVLILSRRSSAAVLVCVAPPRQPTNLFALPAKPDFEIELAFDVALPPRDIQAEEVQRTDFRLAGWRTDLRFLTAVR